MNDTSAPCAPDARRRHVAAIVLLVVALLALAERHLPYAWRDISPLWLGLGFILWAALGRKAGLLIPGGILLGIGAGSLLRFGFGHAVEPLGLAGGFALISVLMRLLFQRRVTWPLFPAGVLAFSVCLELADADTRHWLREIGPLWPYALIVLAAYLLLAKPRVKE